MMRLQDLHEDCPQCFIQKRRDPVFIWDVLLRCRVEVFPAWRSVSVNHTRVVRYQYLYDIRLFNSYILYFVHRKLFCKFACCLLRGFGLLEISFYALKKMDALFLKRFKNLFAK